MYKKQVRISGMHGYLYEIKLISLLYFRAFHDNAIKEFQIASKVDEIGRLNDICFKAKVEGFDKPVMVFILLRHRVNKRKFINIDWARYFDSYVKVRQQLNPKNGSFLNGTFNKTECLFVIYTNARMDLTAASDVPFRSGFFTKLNDLIGTGGTISRPNKQEEYVKLLSEIAVKELTTKEQMTFVAKRIAELTYDDRKFQTLLTDEIVQRFHVILAQKVINLSEIQPGGHRIASFRHDFFDSDEEYLSIFKNTLIAEILKKRRIIPTDLDYLLSECLTEPTDALKLSKLIGTVITYKNGLWELDKQITKTHNPDLIKMDVPRSTVDQAVEIAARDILLFLHFKVPAAFGNKDLTIRGSDTKIDNRIKYLVLKLISLLSMCISSNIVTIDNSLDDGFLQLNGGIAGAIGNIFVLDENPKLMKITDNWEQLGPIAKRLYSKLNSAIHNLHEYKFSCKISKFPKLSFEWDNTYPAEDLTKDFLNRLLFFSNQANENGVEEILKMEIEDYQLDQATYFEAKTEAMFSRYYHRIQKWWMQPHYTECLTRELNLFRQSTNNIIKDPLMSSINFICKSKIKQLNYTFTEDAVSSLNLQNHSTTIISAENSILAVVKLMQHMKSKDHVVLDFNYINNLPTEGCDALCSELKYTNYGKVIILICGDIEQENLVRDKTNSRNDIETLEIIAKALQNKKTIVVTNQKSFKILQKYFPIADKVLQDKKLSLIDLREESQMRIFETGTVIFPGVDIRLDHLLKGWPKSGSRCRSADGAAATSAAADSKTGIGSQQTGAEEWNVPGTSRGRPPLLP